MEDGRHCRRKIGCADWLHGGRIAIVSDSRIFRYFKTSPEIISLAEMMYVRYPTPLRNKIWLGQGVLRPICLV